MVRIERGWRAVNEWPDRAEDWFREIGVIE